MHLFGLLRGVCIIAAGLIVLSACTVVVDDSGPRPPVRPSFCPAIHAPVCGVRFGERRTFSNACMADRAGYRVAYSGQCRRSGAGSGGLRICTREYRPVCARRDGRFRTFGNACEANAAGWRVVGSGRC